MKKDKEAPLLNEYGDPIGLIIDNSPLDSSCFFCVHRTGPRSCKAFDIIPLEIYSGYNKHTEPFEGDHGIQFESALAAKRLT